MPSLRKEPERPRKPWRVDWTGRDRRRHTKRFATRAEAQAAMTAYRAKARADAFLTQVPRR